MAKRAQVPPVPTAIKWAAFLGWLTAPVAAAWATTAAFDLDLLWSGPIWFGYATLYMAGYFGWVRRRAARLASHRTGGESPAVPRR